MTDAPVRPGAVRRRRSRTGPSAPTSSTPAPRSGATGDQRLHRAGSTSRTCRRDAPRCSASTPTSRRPTRSGSSSPRRRTADAPGGRADRGVRRGRRCASGCGSSRCCSSCPRSRARGVGPRPPRAGRAAATARPRSGRRHGQRPADQQRALCVARDRAPRPAPQPHRPAGTPGRRSGRCRRASAPTPFERHRRPSRAAMGIAARDRRRRARSRGPRRRPSGRPPLPAPGEPARLAVRTARTARRGLRLRDRGRPVGPVAVRDADAARPDPRPPLERGDAARRVRAVAARDRRSARSCRAAGGLPARTSSRSCCAGTGRSPTSRATCRSRPACSRPDRTGPSSGRAGRSSRLPGRWARW